MSDRQIEHLRKTQSSWNEWEEARLEDAQQREIAEMQELSTVKHIKQPYRRPWWRFW